MKSLGISWRQKNEANLFSIFIVVAVVGCVIDYKKFVKVLQVFFQDKCEEWEDSRLKSELKSTIVSWLIQQSILVRKRSMKSIRLLEIFEVEAWNFPRTGNLETLIENAWGSFRSSSWFRHAEADLKLFNMIIIFLCSSCWENIGELSNLSPMATQQMKNIFKHFFGYRRIFFSSHHLAIKIFNTKWRKSFATFL